MGKERIGILGGAFDPVHTGHIQMAQIAIKSMRLDRVLMIPCGKSPNKENISDSECRWEMLCAACAPYDNIVPSRIELDKDGISYTCDTIALLKEQNPKADFYLILGADKLVNIVSWRNFKEICKACRFIVFSKSWRYTKEEIDIFFSKLIQAGGKAEIISDETPNVSSTSVRNEFAARREPLLLPVSVLEYCQAYGLYSDTSRIPQFRQWSHTLFRMLDYDRFAHTLAVAYAARSLAMCHNVNPDKAEIAGLLHDCAKCLPLSEQQKICKEYSLTRDESIISAGRLLHGLVGSVLATTIFGIHDSEITQAIAYHTTGKVQMTKLDMIVFLADKIEPTRKTYPALEKMRTVSRVSLERAMLISIDSTADYVKKSGKPLHPASGETAQWLRSIVNGGENI